MKEFEIAKKAVYKAANILKKNLGKISYKLKGLANPVTESDLKSQELIIREIRKEFPKHSFIAEEKELNTGVSDNTWILDPLDGTVNYAHSYPHFSISLAYVKNHILKAAIIFDPFKNEFFHSIKGKGAFLNGHRIKVSNVKSISTSLLATGFAYDRAEKAEYYCSFYSTFLKISHDIRRAGAASLDIAWTACGRIDGYWEFNLKPWDIAAGALIISEAGGKITDFKGNDLNKIQILNWGKETLCSNRKIHKEMLNIIKNKIKNFQN
jgi:myo-inositol-1(or 4)-monophosphatase